MSYTLAEKLLASHTNDGKATAGDIVEANVDLLMVHEVLGSRILGVLEDMEFQKVWDPERIVVVNDHWAPASDINSAEIHRRNRNFVRNQGITHFFDVDCGISHHVLPEKGLIVPGELVIGSDSHSTTYGAFNTFATGLAATDAALILATGSCWFRVPDSIRIDVNGELQDMVMSKDLILKIISDLGPDGANYQSMEFHGDTIDTMKVGERMTISNMSVEAGAKCAPMTVNGRVNKWMETLAPSKRWKPTLPDNDAEYIDTRTYDIKSDPLGPMVATPDNPTNGKAVREVSGVPIDQAFIGSCTNGRIGDLEIAAKILKGKKIREGVRLIITPASKHTWMMALERGLLKIFMEAGGIVTNSTCGACVGGHLGVLGAGEVCISSTNRNFKGRMGHQDSRIYLASPATVAASALIGAITDPRSV
ncbi:MAG: 3-isopropylmalate dehydratase large subunit [Candidatus Thorarchaeota archaeon]|nr:3-isopropylmalate dehydratase large subunit [Candidatus Thorarchaeota archaeon]